MTAQNKAPSRITLTWELGSNLGHIAHLVPLARELARSGQVPSLLLRELHAIKADDFTNCQILQAPVWLPQVTGLPEPPLNYAEILLRFGYHDASCLQGLVTGWRSAFSLLGTDAVVANHAPTALLAARTMGIPAATLGTGFEVPPREYPVPSMRTWLDAPQQRLLDSDRMVTRNINTVLAQFGISPLQCLAELFDVSQNLLCTFPELDHYPQRIPEKQNSRYYGALFEKDHGITVDWLKIPKKRVLIYLRPGMRDFVAILQALAALDCQAVVFAPGMTEAQKAPFESPHCRIFSHRLLLAHLIPECDLAISYGGHGFVSAMLTSGVPLLLLPTHLEQFLLALRVVAIGAGQIVNPDLPPPDFVPLINAMLANGELNKAARRFASKYAHMDRQTQIALIVKAITAMT